MKKLLLLSLSFGLLLSCTQKGSKTIDRAGETVYIPENINRIISTAPSNTKILNELGLGSLIVAVDVYSKNSGLSQAAVVDFRNPDAEALVSLRPDIILASGHNRTGNNDPFAIIRDAGIPVVYIPSADSIDGIYEDIRFISEITNTTRKGEKIITEMKSEIQAIRRIADTIPPEDTRTVYFEIEPEPHLYSTGKNTFQDDMLRIVGADNIFADKSGWLSVSVESVVKRDPDVIITNIASTQIDPVTQIKNRKAFGEVSAVQNNRVYYIDTDASSHPSPSVITAIHEIAKAVYPEYY